MSFCINLIIKSLYIRSVCNFLLSCEIELQTVGPCKHKDKGKGHGRT